MKKNWYRIENNASADESTCYILDEIGCWGVSASQFCADLSAITAKTINLKINSPGGSVFDGNTIHNALKSHPACVNVEVVGLAASIASVICMAGDTITMAKNAMMMIHNASTFASGNAEDLRQVADVLDKIDGTLVNTYADRTGCGKRAIKSMMNDETWMTSDEALKNGFCDCIGSQTDAKACFDLSNFKNTPAKAKALFSAKHEGSEPAQNITATGTAEALHNFALAIQLQNLSASMRY